MGFIKDLARQGKDKALSKSLELLAESAVSRYGRLISIRLNSLNRTVELEVMLKGESAPLSIKMNEYEIITEEGKHYLTCSDISVSREWMKILAEDLLKGKRLEVPAKYAKLVEAVIS